MASEDKQIRVNPGLTGITLEKELQAHAKPLRKTKRSGRIVYSFDHRDSEALMDSLGRLRELSFGDAGGGTNKPADIDQYDTHPTNPYQQLVVWDPETKELIGGYRYQLLKDSPRTGNMPLLASSHLFMFSPGFMNEYFDKTIELGRSFVIPKYQVQNKNSLFALDNLWDGLGTLIVENPGMEYFFGKVTLYPLRNPHSRALIYAFLERHFQDGDDLVSPRDDFLVEVSDHEGLYEIIKGVEGDFKRELGMLGKHIIDEYGEYMPPLLHQYMKLTPEMRSFGTAINRNFGDVEESAILVPIKKIEADILRRYVDYEPYV